MSRRDDPLPDTPYKGLMPYSEEDAPFFFGRKAEREIITANLLASRLTLLYGASGVGKSSVLRAGVAYHLRQVTQQNLAERGTPEFAVVVFSSWSDDPLAGLADRVRDSVAQTVGATHLESASHLESRALAQTLQAWTERVGGDLLIILDQFEEYFLYHPQEDGEGTFAVEFPRAVNRPDLRVSFLISIREDSLAKLDRFKGRIPNLFDNYLRVEHLDREAARAAIEKPVEQYNRLRATDGGQVSVEPALVEAVLEQVRTGQVVLGEAGRGAVGAGLAPTQIETPYLQLVMTRLWEEEMGASSRTLRLETLNRLGGAEQIVKRHLDAALSGLPPKEQEATARVFHHLVTPSGTKIAHTIPDLAEYAELAERQVAPVLDKLSGAEVRILRPVPGGRYEIFHDVLAPAVLDWRARYVQAQERTEAERQLARERRRVRRLRLGLIGLSLLLIVMVALAVFAFQQRDAATRAQKTAVAAAEAEAIARAEADVRQVEAVAAKETAVAERGRAEQQANIALSRQLAAQSARALGTDNYEVASLLAIEAGRRADTTEAFIALRQVLAHRAHSPSGESLRLSGHTDSVYQAVWNAAESRILTRSADGTARVWDAATGEELLALIGHTASVWKAVWNADESRILTASGDGTVRVWDAETGEELFILSDNTGWVQARWNGDESRILTYNDEGTVRVWDAETGEELLTLVGHTDRVNLAAWNADESRILTASADGTVRVWDATRGTEVITLQGHTDRVNLAAWNADESRILTGSGDGTARVWDATTGKELLTLAENLLSVYQAVWNADESRILTGSDDGTARVWDATTGEKLLTLSHDTYNVRQAMWNADETRILSSDLDGTTRVWNATTGELLFILAGHRSLWNADESRILTISDDGTVRVWSADTGTELFALSGHTDRIWQAMWNADESRILTASADGTVRQWYTQMEDLLQVACERVPRNMTREEWQRFLGDVEEYRPTCDNLPAPPPTPTVANTPTPAPRSEMQIAFVSERDGYRAIHIMNPDGSGLMNLSKRAIAFFTWSPDGQRIAFHDFYGIYVIEADGSGAPTRLIEDIEGIEFRQLAWSPDGQRFAFSSSRGIYIINIDGSGLTRLTDHPGTDMSPAWSPDGKRIAFSSDRDGPSGIYVMNTDGSGLMRITDAFGLQPAWSPGGQHIAFKGLDGIQIINVDGSGEATLLVDDWDAKEPSWSPDGQRIAFSSERDGNPEIYVINVDGSGLTRLTNHQGEDSRPAWSPSPSIIPKPLPATQTPTPVPTPMPYLEEKIAFESERDGNTAIYIMNTDGSGMTRLTDFGFHPAWSPAGTQIVFEDVDGISIINADGSAEPTRIVYDPDAWEPAWSADGQRIAFTTEVEDHDYNRDIFIIDIDGGELVNLTNHPAEDTDPAWSPDGTQIAFESDRDGDPSIYVMNADASGLTRLTDDYALDPAWSPDGMQIAFHDVDGISVMNADGSSVTNLVNERAFDLSYAWDPSWSPDGQCIAFSSERDGNREIYVINIDGSGLTRLTNHPGDDSRPAWSP